jgi:hypothetical protein
VKIGPVSVSALLLAVAPTTALAVSPAAEALFREGRRLMAAGQTAEACARFTESNALEASSGKLLNLALCHETLGKTATAWAEYRAAARLAKTEGREDRAAVAHEKEVALDGHLARLTIIVTSPVPGLKIASEDGVLDIGGLNVAVPIDPGVHQLKASAPDYRPWSGPLEIGPGEQKTLTIPALKISPVSTSPLISGGIAARSDPPSRRKLSPMAVGLGIVGAAGLTAGVGFALASQSANGQAESICANQSSYCTNADVMNHQTLYDRALRDEILEVVSFGAGGAALLGAVYLWWRSGAAAPETHVAGFHITTEPLAWSGGLAGTLEVTW